MTSLLNVFVNWDCCILRRKTKCRTENQDKNILFYSAFFILCYIVCIRIQGEENAFCIGMQQPQLFIYYTVLFYLYGSDSGIIAVDCFAANRFVGFDLEVIGLALGKTGLCVVHLCTALDGCNLFV